MEKRFEETLLKKIRISKKRYELLKEAALAARIVDDNVRAEELEQLGLEEYDRLCRLDALLQKSQFTWISHELSPI